MEDICNFGKTSKGKDTACFKKFEYYKHKENKDNSFRWRCREYQRKRCKTFITTKGNRVISLPYPEHSHFMDGNAIEARAAVAEMKDMITGIGAAPSVVIGSQSQNLSSETIMRLPKKPSLRRTLQRVTKNSDAHGRSPNSIEFELPEKFDEILLYDSGIEDQERFLLFGHQEMVAGLSHADLWLADGTFKVVPSIFFQLYTIHFSFGEGRNPAAIYALLCNNNRNTYRRMFAAVREIVPEADPKQILVDFESAAMTEFQISYPNTNIKGCFFHLSQCVYRKAHELGMKTAMESSQELATFILCLPALSLVPPESVEESFDILAGAMPEHERMDELVSYFEHTYIRGRYRRNAATRRCVVCDCLRLKNGIILKIQQMELHEQQMRWKVGIMAFNQYSSATIQDYLNFWTAYLKTLPFSEQIYCKELPVPLYHPLKNTYVLKEMYNKLSVSSENRI